MRKTLCPDIPHHIPSIPEYRNSAIIFIFLKEALKPFCDNADVLRELLFSEILNTRIK
jgi:hypothetical protein